MGKYKISTEIGSAAAIIGEARAVEQVALAGFDGWDFSMFRMKDSPDTAGYPLLTENYRDFAKRLRHIGEENGIRCNQAHAPFPSRSPAVRDYLERALECAAIAGADICVVHPDNRASAEENAELYRALLPTAKQYGVKIAAENMWNWAKGVPTASPAACSHHEDFLKHITAVNDPYLVACLDIGHAEMAGLDTSAEKMILTLASHLRAIHLHDNDRLHDSHQIPFSMDIDFGKIAAALKSVGYGGYITLECDRYLSSIGAKNLTDVSVGLRALAESARKFAKMAE